MSSQTSHVSLNSGLIYDDRVDELSRALDAEPYCTNVDGFHLCIEKGVFPADRTPSSGFLGSLVRNYSPEIALDMGCGCGLLALILRRNRVPLVYASDIHPPAIECSKRNFRMNQRFGESIETCLGDLYDGIESSVLFNLIVFKGICTCLK